MSWPWSASHVPRVGRSHEAAARREEQDRRTGSSDSRGRGRGSKARELRARGRGRSVAVARRWRRVARRPSPEACPTGSFGRRRPRAAAAQRQGASGSGSSGSPRASFSAAQVDRVVAVLHPGRLDHERGSDQQRVPKERRQARPLRSGPRRGARVGRSATPAPPSCRSGGSGAAGPRRSGREGLNDLVNRGRVRNVGAGPPQVCGVDAEPHAGPGHATTVERRGDLHQLVDVDPETAAATGRVLEGDRRSLRRAVDARSRPPRSSAARRPVDEARSIPASSASPSVRPDVDVDDLRAEPAAVRAPRRAADGLLAERIIVAGEIDEIRGVDRERRDVIAARRRGTPGSPAMRPLVAPRPSGCR